VLTVHTLRFVGCFVLNCFVSLRVLQITSTNRDIDPAEQRASVARSLSIILPVRQYHRVDKSRDSQPGVVITTHRTPAAAVPMQETYGKLPLL